MMTPGRMMVLVGGLVFIWLVTSIIATQPADMKSVSATESKISQRSIEPTLLDAIQRAPYQIQTTNDAIEAQNPAQSLRASFAAEEVRIASASACQQPWELSLKLQGYGYGNQLYQVGAGVIYTKDNHVEIHRPLFSPISNLKSQIIEWYKNTPQGLEQGFTLQARPMATATAQPLRIVMEIRGDWEAKLDADQQAITLRNQSSTLRYDRLHSFDATGRELASRMEINGREIALIVDDANAIWPITIDPTLSQQTQFVANNGAAYDHFGASVAIHGDTAVVGVKDFDVSPLINNGAAFVFVRDGATWTQQARLTANDAASSDNFGISVAISGDTIVVGANADDIGTNTDQGAAYVFVRSGSTWTQQAKLTVSNGASNDWFGYAVAISGDTVLVGAPLDDFDSTINQGSAYVYVRNGAMWSFQKQLNASDLSDNDSFGLTIALQNDTAVIGAPTDDVGVNTDQGSSYVFVRNGATWSQQQQLLASDGASIDLFGYAVAISNETILVGAPRDDFGAVLEQGSAYAFVRSNATWSQQTKLIASNGAGGDTFGSSVAISNDMVVIGAPTDDVGGSIDQGSAYVFVRNDATWSQQQQTLASSGASNDNVGNAVAISGFTSLISAPNDDVNTNTDQGSVYVFSPTCPTMTLSPTTLGNGTQNLAYPTTTISSSAGTAPPLYSIVSGALPAGLNLSSSGVLSGTPTAAGNFNFTIKVTDANLCTGTRAYSLAIASCTPPTISTQPANQSSAVGNSVAFTAAADGTLGTVQWQISPDGNNWSNVIGATNATLSLSNLAITMNGNRYRAVFTNACGTVTSNAATLTVNKLSPTVSLNLSVNTITYGQSVTLNASVSSVKSIAPTGTITFKSGTNTIGAGTIVNGQASVSLNVLPAAVHSMTAEYSGDINYVSGVSNPNPLTVNKAKLIVTAENKTKVYGSQNPELTATITGFVNNENSSIVSGAALITTTATQTSRAGNYPINVALGTLSATNYDFAFVNGSLTIGKSVLTVAAANKIKVFGAPLPELTYTITGFLNSDQMNVVSGAPIVTTTATQSSNVGNYPINISLGTLSADSYDFNFVQAELTISQAATNTMLVSNAPSSFLGQAVTFTANVSAIAPSVEIPNGVVIFKNGANVIGTSDLVNGQAALTISSLEIGTHSITAEFNGSENFIASASSVISQSVSKSPAIVTLASSFDSVRYGQAVTLNATVNGNGATPTGNVRFMNGSALLGTATLTNGAASLTVNNLSVATHTLTVIYDGDAKNDSGASRNFILTVNKAVQPVNIGVSANPVAWKQFVTITASVNVMGNGLAAPTGTIVFKEGATELGRSALSRLGRASISTNSLSTGAHSITAEFSGDNSYEAASASAVMITIGKAATAIRLNSSTKTTTNGQPVIFTAQIHSSAGTPTGSVEFYDGAQLMTTETISNGVASWTTTSLSDGEHSIKAVYKGDERFETSASASIAQNVSPICTWSLSAKNYAVDLNGGTGFVTVASRSDCFWSAYTNDPWITIPDSGTEAGAVRFSVAPLTTGASRNGVIYAAGQTITVLQTKPVVTVSGASYAREGLAPEAIVSAFGEGMATTTEIAKSLPLPTTLSGIQVRISDSKGIDHFAPLFYATPLQINYMIPAEVAFGPVLVTIQTPSGEINGGGIIEVTPIIPGLFTANANGSGVAAADVQRVLVDGSQRYEPIYRFDSAQNKVVSVPIDFGEEGEDVYLVLFGTGLRSRLSLAAVRAVIDNEDIEVLYVGAQGGYVGLDQINLKLPRRLAGKGEVDLKLFVEGKFTNTVRINLK